MKAAAGLAFAVLIAGCRTGHVPASVDAGVTVGPEAGGIDDSLAQVDAPAEGLGQVDAGDVTMDEAGAVCGADCEANSDFGLGEADGILDAAGEMCITDCAATVDADTDFADAADDSCCDANASDWELDAPQDTLQETLDIVAVLDSTTKVDALFGWPATPLDIPIDVTAPADCASTPTVADAASAAECATATHAAGIASAVCSGKPGYLYVVGGKAWQDWLDDGEMSATGFRLDLATGTWTKLPPMPYVKFVPVAEFVQGKLVVASGQWYMFANKEVWPGKYQAPCFIDDAGPYCPFNVVTFTGAKWSALDQFIGPGGVKSGSMARSQCNLLVTDYDVCDVHDGQSLNLIGKLAVEEVAETTSHQALVPWGEYLVLFSAASPWAKTLTPTQKLLTFQGALTNKVLPGLPCPIMGPIAWTNGKHLFVSNGGSIDNEKWEKKGCVGVGFTPGWGNNLFVLRWTGTQWVKAPSLLSSLGPSTVVDTPVGSIAVGVNIYKGTLLPYPDQTYSGVMVQDKKTFIWKDDVYPPMPHGKIGATAVWAPK